jgi:hypothetical protein
MVFVMGAAMYVGYTAVSPTRIFDLPINLSINQDINSYFFQGLCVALAATITNIFLNLPKFAPFNLSILIAMCLLLLQSARSKELDIYFAQYSVLPFLIGVASCLFVVGYVLHFTKQGKS